MYSKIRFSLRNCEGSRGPPCCACRNALLTIKSQLVLLNVDAL
jgi:hypothetical protein